LSNDQNGLFALQPKGLDPFHAGVYGLYEAGLLKADAVRDWYGTVLNDPVHHPDVFSEAAAGRLKSGGAADFLVGLALCERFGAAIEAFATRDVMKDHDPVADTEFANTVADASHYA